MDQNNISPDPNQTNTPPTTPIDQSVTIAQKAEAAAAMTGPQTTPVMPEATKTANAGPDINQKIEAARVAMEGPERSAKRQQEEKEAEVKQALALLDAEKQKTDKQKETLEIAWVGLDEKRGAIKKELQPILDQEKQVEDEEGQLELEEEKAAAPDQKKLVEKKRWDVQDKRKALEQQKWALQDKLIELEKQIGDNTKRYQTLLDEEDAETTKRNKLEGELS